MIIEVVFYEYITYTLFIILIFFKNTFVLSNSYRYDAPHPRYAVHSRAFIVITGIQYHKLYFH